MKGTAILIVGGAICVLPTVIYLIALKALPVYSKLRSGPQRDGTYSFYSYEIYPLRSMYVLLALGVVLLTAGFLLRPHSRLYP